MSSQPGRDLRGPIAKAIGTPLPAGAVEWADTLIQNVISVDDLVRYYGAERRIMELGQTHAGAGTLATTIDPFNATSYTDVPPETEADPPEVLVEKGYDLWILGWGCDGSNLTSAVFGATTQSVASPEIPLAFAATGNGGFLVNQYAYRQFLFDKPLFWDRTLFQNLRFVSTASAAATVYHTTLIAMIPRGLIPR